MKRLLACAVAVLWAAHPAAAQGRADSGAARPDGTTALHAAVYAGDERLARELLRGGADANAVNRYGVTPLAVAARAGNAALVDLLLNNRADRAAADAALRDGQTTLMLAAGAGSAEAVTALAARGAAVNAVERRTGTSALVWAAVGNHAGAIRALLRAGADVNVRSKVTAFPHTPPGVIGDALEAGSSYVGQTVLPKGGWTPLMYAARQGSGDAAAALIDAGANLDAQDPDGTTALAFAVINGHAGVAGLLAARGANPDIGDRTGMTPLYAAVDLHTMAKGFGRPDPPPHAVAGAVEMVKMLLAHGADPNPRLTGRTLKRVYTPGDGRLGKGATPYMRAARAGDAQLMRILLAGGADPALTQENGNSPLLLSAGVGHRGAIGGTEAMAIETIALSLERGADINAVNNAGDTAVHVAATTDFAGSGTAAGSARIIRFLAERGATLDVKNKQGRTPLDAVLRAREHSAEVVALLRELSPAGSQ